MTRFLPIILALILVGSVERRPLHDCAADTLRALPVPWFDPAHPLPETDAERDARLGRIAVEAVTQTKILDDETGFLTRTGFPLDAFIALALAGAYNESALAWEVHAGQEWPGRPAPFGDKGRARCLFQLQPSASMVPRDAFRPFDAVDHPRLAGLDEEATRRCVRAGVRAFAWQVWRCQAATRAAVAEGDRSARYAIAVIYSEYHRPSDCRFALSPGSLRRADAMRGFLARLRAKR